VAAITGKGMAAVPTTTLRALGALVSAAEEVEAHLGLCVLVHASGVDAAGNVGYLTLAGKGRYEDPDVLRVLSDVHQYARCADVLAQASVPCGSRSARLVGAATRPTPFVSPLPPISDEDMELYDVMTSPFDDELPPPVEWQRLARRVMRSRSNSPTPASPDEGDSSGGGAPAPADGSSDGAPPPVDSRVPFLPGAIPPPPVYMPEKEIEDIFLELTKIGPAFKLVRNVHKVIIFVLAAKFGVHPRTVQEGLSRWWPHRLIVNQAGDGQVSGGRWPLGVSVRTSLLPTTQRTRGGGGEDGRTAGRRVVTLTGVPNSERCTQEAAVASLLLLWGKEHRVRKPIRTALFRAQLAYQAKKNRIASSTRKASEAAAAAGLAVTPGVAAASAAAAAAGRGTNGGGRHVVLAPRPATPQAVGAAVENITAAPSALAATTPGVSSVLAARAAARAAAATGPVFRTLPAVQAPTSSTKRGAAGASGAAGGSPTKRICRTAVRERGASAAVAVTASSAAARATAAPALSAPLVSPFHSLMGVDEGPHDLLDEDGLQVAHEVVQPERKVLHGRAIPEGLLVVLLQGVFNPRCLYAHQKDFPMELPGEVARPLGDAVGSYIVWDRELVLPA